MAHLKCTKSHKHNYKVVQRCISKNKKNLLPLKALLQVSIVHHHVAMNHLGPAGSDVEPISLLWTSCQTAAVLDGWSEKPIFHSAKIINPNCNAAYPRMVG